MNRSERRSRKKYYKKLLKDHEKAKPSVDLTKEDEAAFQQQMALQRWATRYGILKRKLEELG